MKNKILAIIAILVVCLPIITKATPFYAVFNAKEFSDFIKKENITKENFLNLPSEKLVEDFEYYFKTMKENSPLFNATKRHNPDLEKQFEEYKKKISESKSNFEQLSLIDEFSRKFLGHNGINFRGCGHAIRIFNSYPKRKTWANMLSSDPLVKRNTNLFSCFSWLDMYSASQDSKPKEKRDNIETKILEPDKIAYIKVRSFSGFPDSSNDEKTIGEFFEKTKDYENIIIDITGNSGGTTDYLNCFMPILKKTLVVTRYMLFKMGDNSSPYINEEYSNEIQPIDKLPEFLNLNQEDKKENTHFAKRVDSFKSLPNPVRGKVWLLVDDKVFSASEYFTILCKSSKEVTIVGKNTSGDGLSAVDPILMILPNSKVAMRYSVDYGLNEDGSCNAECGTKPDIVSPDGEDPLTTCLKTIRMNEN